MRNSCLLIAALSFAVPALAQSNSDGVAAAEATASTPATTKKVCKRVADVNSLVAKKVCRVVAVEAKPQASDRMAERPAATARDGSE